MGEGRCTKGKEGREKAEGRREKEESCGCWRWWWWWWWWPRRRCFREPRSTFNHLRSITSGEVMAGFSCRGRRSGLFALSRPIVPLPSSLSPYESLPANVFPSARPPSDPFCSGSIGPSRSRYRELRPSLPRDWTPFEAHLIDRVLMKMIPGTAPPGHPYSASSITGLDSLARPATSTVVHSSTEVHRYRSFRTYCWQLDVQRAHQPRSAGDSWSN